MTAPNEGAPDLSLSPAVVEAVGRLDRGIAQAVAEAKAAGLAQGLVVSLLHGHTAIQTNAMVNPPVAK